MNVQGEEAYMENCIHQVLNGTMELILFFDENSIIYYHNDAALKQLRYETLDGVSMAAVFPQLFEENKPMDASLWEQDNISAATAYRKNQTCFPVNVKFTKVIHNGKTGFMCAAWNTALEKEAIKDINKAKEEAAHATTLRNDFVANVTHELRTPVNGILGHAKNLMETELNGEQKKTVEIIENCCDNMIKIINNLLDFSKLEAGRFTIEEKEFDFRDLMDQVMSLHINTINDKGLRLVMNVASDIPRHLIGDELCIKQILNNLISNAIKFTSVGQIAVQVTKTMQIEKEIELFFMVIDTGIGIEPEKKDLLFQSFYQADASITRRFGGTGLGLSICKELVELMGGTISVDSIKDKGSTFSFTLRLKLTDSDAGSEEFLPSGNFVYETAQMLKNAGASGQISEQEPVPDMDEIFKFGTKENLEEIHSTMEKMLLCIDMGTWEKAENFAGVVKRLVDGNPSLKRYAFRLEMTVRKEDHDKAVEQFHTLKEALESAEAELVQD
jgi:signal transduction histidine kinase